MLPAIDVSEGRLAAYGPGGPRPVDAFGGDPAAAARAFVEAGASWLHVVDLDLAWLGEVVNASVLRSFRESFPDVSIQASGGVAAEAEVATLIAAGASRVILGSAALGDPEMAGTLIEVFGDRLVVGLEVHDGRIRPRGRRTEDLDLMETLGWLAWAGASTFLVTSIDRVGHRAGPDVDTIRRVARAGRPVLAAGGIASVEHLRAAREAGASGAVVGRAALEGTLDLRDALAFAGTA